jgi:hypothetical protein
MPLPQLEKMPSFHITVSHPPDTPELQTSNFLYQPYQSTHEGKKRISKAELLRHTEDARDWLTYHNGGNAFGFIFADGTYDLFPSNECLGLINCPERFCRDKPVAYFIGAASGSVSNTTKKAVDWLLNRSPYAVVFVTKDAEEAIKKGVILNTKRCVAITVAALRSFYTLSGGMASNWEKWAEYVPEDIAWPFAHYLRFVGDSAVQFSDNYSWSSTMGKNIGIDGIKRFTTHDYSLHDTTPMRDKPYRYEDFSHLWRTKDKKVHVPFKPATINTSVTKKNSFSGKNYTMSYNNVIPGKNMQEVAANLLSYIGYPYEA